MKRKLGWAAVLTLVIATTLRDASRAANVTVIAREVVMGRPQNWLNNPASLYQVSEHIKNKMVIKPEYPATRVPDRTVRQPESQGRAIWHLGL